MFKWAKWDICVVYSHFVAMTSDPTIIESIYGNFALHRDLLRQMVDPQAQKAASQAVYFSCFTIETHHTAPWRDPSDVRAGS
jgi:hypothetical protein